MYVFIYTFIENQRDKSTVFFLWSKINCDCVYSVMMWFCLWFAGISRCIVYHITYMNIYICIWEICGCVRLLCIFVVYISWCVCGLFCVYFNKNTMIYMCGIWLRVGAFTKYVCVFNKIPSSTLMASFKTHRAFSIIFN